MGDRNGPEHALPTRYILTCIQKSYTLKAKKPPSIILMAFLGLNAVLDQKALLLSLHTSLHMKNKPL